MKVLSLFDGISCARVALQRLGIVPEKYYSSEIDKYAMIIAQKNFPDTIQLGDVRTITKDMVGDIDLLIGGSPCQDLSIAKQNRQGLDGARSGLFWEYVRILREVKPKYFVLENVNSMPNEAKQIITETLGVEPVMINAALVSAQNRKRLFWVGKLSGEKYEQVRFDLPEDRGILLKDIIENGIVDREKSRTIASSNGRTTFREYFLKNQGQMVCLPQSQRIYSTNGKSVALQANGGGMGAKKGLYFIKAPNGKEMEIDIEKMPHVFKEVRTEQGKKFRSEYRKKFGKDTTKRGKDDKKYIADNCGKSNCITTGLGIEGLLAEKGIVRKLTPVECERLQSLPDNYTMGVSNTQRYKALGNAFNVEVVKHILSFLFHDGTNGKDNNQSAE